MTMTDETKPTRPLHPALHLERDLALVGILDASGKPVIVLRRTGQLPARVLPRGSGVVESRFLHPAPVVYPPLSGRWDAGDVASFCEQGSAPSFADCLVSVREELTRRIEFTRPETASLVACWIVGTYFHPMFTTFPRLNITGPKGAGKSKTLQVIAAIAFNGAHVVSPTPSTLFRLIEPLRPTFCLDEMEQLDRADARAIKPILNAGYKAGATVPRTEGDKKREVVSYQVYGPVAIAGIRGLDDVLADRSITVLMQRGADRSRVNSEVDPADPAWGRVRALCYRLVLTRGLAITRAVDAVRARQGEFTTLEGRPLELYRPLIALGVLAKAEGDESFITDLSVLVQDEAETRESLDPEAVRLFAELERRLRAAPFVVVSPGDSRGY
jgi:hypothetical protein